MGGMVVAARPRLRARVRERGGRGPHPAWPLRVVLRPLWAAPARGREKIPPRRGTPPEGRERAKIRVPPPPVHEKSETLTPPNRKRLDERIISSLRGRVNLRYENLSLVFSGSIAYNAGRGSPPPVLVGVVKPLFLCPEAYTCRVNPGFSPRIFFFREFPARKSPDIPENPRLYVGLPASPNKNI